ncbi:hypothetical protein BD311DRAFT_628592, partial [Dichomitus squalens]
LDQQDISYISSILQANSTLYLDEIQERLLETRGVDVSVATLSRTIRRLDLTSKRIAKEALERNELLQATWQAAHGHIPMEYIMWLDESSIDDRTNQRNNG